VYSTYVLIFTVSDCRVLVRDICYLIFTVSDCRVLVRDICYLIFTVSDCRVLVRDICYSKWRNNEIFLISHQKENLCCLCIFMSDSMALVAERNYVNVIRISIH
jgi:hypothetical protein